MRRFLAPVFTLTALVLAPVPASAQQTETVVLNQNLGWLKINNETEFTIRGTDGVKDGCWTNIEAAKNAVAIEFQRSGYKAEVSEINIFAPKIFLYAVGYETTNFICIVSYNLVFNILGVSSPTFGEEHKVTSLHFSQIWRRSGIMSGPKGDMSQRIKDTFVELAQQLLLDIPKERREVLKAVRESAAEDKDAQPKAYRYWMAFPD